MPTYFCHHKLQGELDADGSTREEWLLRSALIAPSNAKTAARNLWTHDIEFGSPSWHDGVFDFGDSSKPRAGITLYPWIHTYKHPTTGNVEMRLREDFIRYHALRPNGESEWVHPVDGTPVVRMELYTHPFYDPAPLVLVYRRYLLDYLAATKRRLLICVVADRFAIRDSDAALGIEDVENESVGEYTKITTNFTGAPLESDSLKGGRGSLYRNQVLAPSGSPAISDSPWPNFGRNIEADSTAPLFIVDDEGSRAPLNQVHPQAYLFFKPEVLERHFTQDGYGVFFHMRTWGRTWHPVGRMGVDTGINPAGLVVAFAKDLQDLRPSDQNYWSGFTVNPHGGHCEEMFQTRMQCAPPHSPGTVELLEQARTTLHDAYQTRFGAELFCPHELTERVRMRMSVGPLRDDVAELCGLAKDTFIWLGDALRKKALSPHTGLAQEDMKELGTIRLLERVLVQVGAPPDHASRLCRPLDALRFLRVADAHTNRNAAAQARRKLELSNTVGLRELWFAIVDGIASAFDVAARALHP
ncbi:MAG: hypothetical protein KDE27_16310 [Planctomycetes bacterium]|nr:hypothetical protein [Planctomycetota bacterium]